MKVRRGFALLAVLWVVVLLTTIIAGGVHAARMDGAAALNRVALERGRWAAEACLARALSRLDSLQHARAAFRPAPPDSLVLAGGARCTSSSAPAPPDSAPANVAAVVFTAIGRDSAVVATSFIEVLIVPVGNRVGVIRRRQW
jgi:Tfp pilus assembly protein PilX